MKLLIRGGHVLQMDAAGTVLEDGYVLIEDSRVVEVGHVSDAPPASEVNHVEDASGCVVVPGLINSHQHHWYQLLKGTSVGMYLEDWVQQVLGPATAALGPQHLVGSISLAAADMLSKGTTTFFNHSVTETDVGTITALAEASAATGIRHIFAKEVRATPQSSTVERHRADVEHLLQLFPMGADRLFSVALAVESGEHFMAQGMMTPELATYAADLAARHGVPISDHITGGTLSRSVVAFRHRTGLGQVQWLARQGLLGSNSLLAHSVWIDESEAALAAQSGATIVTCPSSSAFTAGGIPPVRDWLAAGVNVAIGSDGPMVNDSVDILGLLREAFLLQNVKYLVPGAVSIEDLWKLATRNGARGLGFAGEIGEISVGAVADIAVFDLRKPEFGGALRPAVNLILSGSGHEARFVMVNGMVVKDTGGLRTMDVDKVVRQSRDLARDLADRAGLPL